MDKKHENEKEMKERMRENEEEIEDEKMRAREWAFW